MQVGDAQDGLCAASEDAGTLRYPGAPFRPEATPWAISRPAPGVGEHNAEVLGAELSMADETLEALTASGVI